MNYKLRRFALVCSQFLLWVYASSMVYAQPTAEQNIDAAVERAMALFSVPGMTVAVVHDGQLVVARGYGVRETGHDDPVDGVTLFQIASLSKAFTAASLALLVDEGRLNWDDKVIDYLPDFRMYDPWVTREFTIRDLLTHRSGLPLGAGDLLVFPAGETTIDEVIRAMRFLQPTSSFRAKYDYDNLMYIIAGQLIASVSGMTYPDFVQSRLLKPLGMNDCRVGASQSRSEENRATPHVLVDGELQTTFFENSDLIAAAGGVNCGSGDMARWLQMWLSQGQLSSGEPVISPGQVDEMLSPVTLVPTNKLMKENAGSHLSAYALGWGLSSFYGEPIYTHGGLLWGMTSFIALMPEQNLAVFVSNNQMSNAPRAVGYHILDYYLGGGKDWLEIYHASTTKKQQEADQVVADAAAARNADSRPSLPLAAYAGTYRDAWYGEIYIELKDGGLHFRSARSTQLSGPLEHFQFDTFIARWTDRQLMADAYVSFYLTPEGTIERIAMKAVSPETDFSYDFHDLDLRYIGPEEAPE